MKGLLVRAFGEQPIRGIAPSRVVEFCMEFVSGWLVRSEVGSGLLQWCNSIDVRQIGAEVFFTSDKCALNMCKL